MLVGSRRRRLALASSQDIPFSLLPYQCFQEARKVIAADRVKKIEQIEEQRRRISFVTADDAATMGGEAVKKGRLLKMEDYLERLKVLADINDPLVKKKFEDGLGELYLYERLHANYLQVTCHGLSIVNLQEISGYR